MESLTTLAPHLRPKVVGISMNGQENNLSREARRLYLPCCGDAVHDRHRDVKHQDIGLKFGNFIDDRLPITDGFDNVEFRLQNSCRKLQEILVVIGQ